MHKESSEIRAPQTARVDIASIPKPKTVAGLQRSITIECEANFHARGDSATQLTRTEVSEHVVTPLDQVAQTQSQPLFTTLCSAR